MVFLQQLTAKRKIKCWDVQEKFSQLYLIVHWMTVVSLPKNALWAFNAFWSVVFHMCCMFGYGYITAKESIQQGKDLRVVEDY